MTSHKLVRRLAWSAAVAALAAVPVLSSGAAFAAPVSSSAPATFAAAASPVVANAEAQLALARTLATARGAELRAAYQDAVARGLASQTVLDAAEQAGVFVGGGSQGAAHNVSDIGANVLASIATVIDPTQYTCTSTPLNDYAMEQVLPARAAELLKVQRERNWTLEEAQEIVDLMPQIMAPMFIAQLGGFDATAYDTIVHADDPRFTQFGTGGGQTNLIKRTVKDVGAFWDVPDRRLHLAAMKSTIVTSTDSQDIGRFGAAALFIASASQGNQPDRFPPVNDITTGYGAVIKSIISQAPVLKGGASDIFTFNAFALDPSEETTPELRTFGNQVVYGDGLLNAQAAIGLDKVGASVVIGHEFGHQIQYANDVFDGFEGTPEATRRTELMADAYGAYFAAHKGGLTYNAKRVTEAAQMSWEVGDCGFDSAGHHGTPEQRLRTAEWAAGLAAGAKPKDVLASKKLQALFDAQLPTLIAPDKK